MESIRPMLLCALEFYCHLVNGKPVKTSRLPGADDNHNTLATARSLLANAGRPALLHKRQQDEIDAITTENEAGYGGLLAVFGIALLAHAHKDSLPPKVQTRLDQEMDRIMKELNHVGMNHG